jgi:hypothetical protein
MQAHPDFLTLRKILATFCALTVTLTRSLISMHINARPYLTAGMAALSAGAIAVSPIQPVQQHMAAAQQPAIHTLAVNLAATIDPITPIVNTITTSLANITNLATLAAQQPFPFASTILANVGTYIQELLSGNVGLIPEQIINNIMTFFQAPMDIGTTVVLPPNDAVPYEVPVANGGYASSTVPLVGNAPQPVAEVFVQAYAGDWILCEINETCDPYYQNAAPITNFLNSHASGVLLGLLGPILSPVLQLGNSVGAIVGSLQTGDFLGAINELINIPVNVVNAFLNGVGVVDVTGLIATFATLPDSITQVTVNLGGLLTATPQNGSLLDPADPPTVFGGGVAIDAVGLTTTGPDPFAVGVPVGLLGSVIGTGQFIAEQMRVTPPVQATANSVRAAATAAPVEVVEPFASDALNDADAPSAGNSQAPAGTPAAPTRSGSRAKAAASNGDSHSGARGRRGAA